MAREWDYFSGIESMTHCMPRENRSVRSFSPSRSRISRDLEGPGGTWLDLEMRSREEEGPRARFGVPETTNETS